MHYGPITYMKDGLITSHNLNAINDKYFKKAFFLSRTEFINLHSLYHEWRLYTAAVITERAFLKAIPNNFIFVECGVGMGINNFFIQTYLRIKYGENLVEKHFKYFGIDTFSGIAKQYLTEEELPITAEYRFRAYGNQSLKAIDARFKKFNNSKLIQGTIPEILSNLDFSKCDFLHVDMNNALPEVEAISFFLPLMTKNSFMLLDDYGFSSAHIQRKSIDDLFKSRNLTLPISLPTGQGLVLI
jgi:hypothetical protein